MVLIVDAVRDRKIMQIYTVLKIDANGNWSFFVYIRFCDVGLRKAKTYLFCQPREVLSRERFFTFFCDLLSFDFRSHEDHICGDFTQSAYQLSNEMIT